MESDLTDLVRKARSRNPSISLPALGEIRRNLDELETIEASAVATARAASWSWGRIAEQLGRARQGVWEKHGRKAEFEEAWEQAVPAEKVMERIRNKAR
jgi:hypothetical protein